MAGIIRAKGFCSLHWRDFAHLNPRTNRIVALRHSLPHPKFTPPVFSKLLAKMTGEANGAENHCRPEVKEPLQKIPKLDHDDCDSPEAAVPLLRVKKLSENAVLPSRASPLSAGYDLSSAVAAVVPGGGKALVPTDLSISIPEGTYARVAPRSGLAWKHSIDVGAGVIDADYRGPVGVVLFNHSDIDFEIKPGDRIAQLIIERIMTPEVLEVDDLDPTARGGAGFGSTGV